MSGGCCLQPQSDGDGRYLWWWTSCRGLDLLLALSCARRRPQERYWMVQTWMLLHAWKPTKRKPTRLWNRTWRCTSYFPQILVLPEVMSRVFLQPVKVAVIVTDNVRSLMLTWHIDTGLKYVFITTLAPRTEVKLTPSERGFHLNLCQLTVNIFTFERSRKVPEVIFNIFWTHTWSSFSRPLMENQRRSKPNSCLWCCMSSALMTWGDGGMGAPLFTSRIYDDGSGVGSVTGL